MDLNDSLFGTTTECEKIRQAESLAMKPQFCERYLPF